MNPKDDRDLLGEFLNACVVGALFCLVLWISFSDCRMTVPVRAIHDFHDVGPEFEYEEPPSE